MTSQARPREHIARGFALYSSALGLIVAVLMRTGAL